jgi:hypothetical protein
MIHRFQIAMMAATIVSDGPLLPHAPDKFFLGPSPEVLTDCLTASDGE